MELGGLPHIHFVGVEICTIMIPNMSRVVMARVSGDQLPVTHCTDVSAEALPFEAQQKRSLGLFCHILSRKTSWRGRGRERDKEDGD